MSDRELLKQFLETDCSDIDASVKAIEAAGRSNSLLCFKSLLNLIIFHGNEKIVAKKVAYRGNLDCVQKLLMVLGIEGFVDIMAEGAREGGQLKCLEYLNKHQTKFPIS